MNMQNCGHCNCRKHREIKNSEQYIALDIYLKFGNMDKMKITSPEPKYYQGRSRKGLIVSLSINTITRSKKIKQARFYITEVSLKDLSKIIKEFKGFPYEGYVRKRSKHIPTDSYFYLAMYIAKYTMRNFHGTIRAQNISMQKMRNYNISTQNMSNLHVCYTDESE